MVFCHGFRIIPLFSLFSEMNNATKKNGKINIPEQCDSHLLVIIHTLIFKKIVKNAKKKNLFLKLPL